jgi:hypothetical protein
MVNLSPTDESYFESLCSLRFASQVNQCELGKPKKQIKDIVNSMGSGNVMTEAPKATTTTTTAKTLSVLGKTQSTVGATKTAASSAPSPKLRKTASTRTASTKS